MSFHRYAFWSFVSNIFSSIEMVMSSHSMLAVVSKSGPEALMTANYLLKDMVGQLGGIAYVSKLGSTIDKNPHQIAIRSIAYQQVAMFAECITPLTPSYFLPIASCANVVQNISFIGLGGVNARIIKKLSDESCQIGEVYSKISVINTAGSTIGMLLGLGLVTKIPDHTTRLALFPFIAYGRVVSYNMSIKNLL